MHFTQQRDPKKHLIGVMIVIALHIIIVWALVTGLAQKIVDVVKAPLETKIIQEIKPPPPPPHVSLPPPKLTTLPPPFIPPPEVVVATPPPVASTIQVTTTVVPPEPVAMVPKSAAAALASTDGQRGPHRIPPVIDAKQACEEPEYPSASRRNEEMGTVVLRFLVEVNGHVVDSNIATSSGFSRLDRAARDTLSRCIFKPGTLDGKPEQAWASIRYTWHLN
jgi:periplasmic protein TonB